MFSLTTSPQRGQKNTQQMKGHSLDLLKKPTKNKKIIPKSLFSKAQGLKNHPKQMKEIVTIENTFAEFQKTHFTKIESIEEKSQKVGQFKYGQTRTGKKTPPKVCKTTLKNPRKMP